MPLSADSIAAPVSSGFDAGFLTGGGEMGELIRASDWSRTPLGPPATWPQSLRTALSIMLEARFAMVVAWGPEFRFFYNNGYRPILGTKHPTALGTPGHEIFPEVWDVVGPEFERVRRGESFAVEDWLLPLDRNGYLEDCWFTLSYSPIRDESGGVGGLLAVVAETTDRVQGERRLATLRELARRANEGKTIADVCEQATAVFDANQVDVPFSLAYVVDHDERQARLASTSQVVPGSPPAPALIDLDAEEDDGAWPIARAIGRHEAVVVDGLCRRFGPLPGGPHPEPAHTALVLPLSRTGAALPYGALVVGVSPRRALDDRYRAFFELAAEHVVAGLANASAYEEERRRAEMLAELDRAKTAFFSNVSHEFRTPLTLMLGPLEDLLGRSRPSLPAPIRDDIATAHRNALRLLKLVNSLLDFSRVEAGRAHAAYEPVDLAAVTVDLASLFRAAIERAGLRLEVRCDPLPELVYVDRGMWEKIVLNLLSNALKFTMSGTIGVQLRWAGEFVELEVRDTGVGIPASEHENIFTRFHRVQDTRARTHEGSGIGLALVHDLAALHGGGVAVTSAPDQGSTFVVRVRSGTTHLPAHQVDGSRTSDATAHRTDAFIEEALHWLPEDDRASRTPEHGPADTGDSVRRGGRVLVVDDNADMRAYLARLLQDHYDVDTATDGEDALRRVAAQRPDLVLADVMMPRLDGFGLVQALRAGERTRELPVILLSARAGEESTVEGLAEGADDYIVKPFTAGELLARVRTHLELAAARALASRERERLADVERRRFASIFERAPALIAVLRGPKHVFEAANPAYRALVGDYRELIGKTIRDALPEIEGQGFCELLDRVYATGEPYVGTEARVLLRRGADPGLEEAFVNFVYQPLTEPDGTVSGIFVHGIEVTTQVRARRQVEELYEQVQEANETKMKFLAAMSHELRTPLNAILGYSDLLSLGVRGQLADAQRADVDRIQAAARYLLGLISDILNFARLEAGEIDMDVRPVDVSAILARAAELVVQPLAEKGLQFVYSPPPPLAVLADSERAQQVVLNLLTNAIKFTDHGGTVSLVCETDDVTARLHVRDTGPGIRTEHLARIFEPFVQIGPATGRDAVRRGVGLGLTISRDLARKMGGDVGVTSTVGDGSDFVLSLRRAN